MFDEKDKTKEEWLQWISDNKSLFQIPKGEEATFYSGGILADREARQHCSHWGSFAIWKTTGGEILEKAKLHSIFDRKTADSIWDKASEIYAESAEGKVRAFVQTATNDNTFFNVELPTLFKENKVTHINEVPLEKIKTIWDKDTSEEKEQAKAEIKKELTLGVGQITWEPTFKEPDPKKEEIQKKDQIETQKKEEQAKAEELKKEEPTPKEKTTVEIEKEEKIAKRIVEAVIEEAKTAAIGAIGGSALATAYEAKKALDEAKEQEQSKSAQETEQSYKVPITYNGRKATMEVSATSLDDAKERVKALFENEEFRNQVNARSLKPGESLSGKAEIAKLPEEQPKPFFLTEQEKKKRDEQEVTIKIESPSLSQ